MSIKSSMCFSSGKRTICEVLREINDLHQGETEADLKTRALLYEAQQMAKKMSFKLLEYNKEVFNDWWEKNEDYEKDLVKRLSKNYLADCGGMEIDKELLSKAMEIPHMGSAAIGSVLAEYASLVPVETKIVEVGAWLGSGTAFLAIGAKKETEIHVFDRFKANKSESDKAAAFEVKIKPGQDTLPFVKKTLSQFGGNIIYHKGDNINSKWDGSKIGLYIDDASKSGECWDHVTKTFLPHVITGGKIVLMDFFYYKKTGSKRHKEQLMFVNRHKNNFQMIESFDNISAAIFVVKKQLGK